MSRENLTPEKGMFPRLAVTFQDDVLESMPVKIRRKTPVHMDIQTLRRVHILEEQNIGLQANVNTLKTALENQRDLGKAIIRQFNEKAELLSQKNAALERENAALKAKLKEQAALLLRQGRVLGFDAVEVRSPKKPGSPLARGSQLPLFQSPKPPSGSARPSSSARQPRM
ncbi:MAG: hypothetical protein Q8L78_01650 [Coxiellaceae bacterium]|nr:hypothetical protein [Coxiellaceae bacterium]